MLLFLLVLTSVSYTKQHYYYPGIDYCGLAVACIHDGRPICAATPDGCGRRTFLDQCDMYEFNCDFGTRYQETYFYYCQTANYVTPPKPSCGPGIYVIPPFVEVVNEKDNEIVPMISPTKLTTTTTTSPYTSPITSTPTTTPYIFTSMSTTTEIKTTTTTTEKTTESPTTTATEAPRTTKLPTSTETSVAPTTTTTTTVKAPTTTTTTTTKAPTTTTTHTTTPTVITEASTTRTTKTTTTQTPSTTTFSTRTSTVEIPSITTLCCDRPTTWETTEGEVPPIITELFDPPKSVITTSKKIFTTTTESPTTTSKTTDRETQRSTSKPSVTTAERETTSSESISTVRSISTSTKGTTTTTPHIISTILSSLGSTPCCDRPATWETTRADTKIIDYTEQKLDSTTAHVLIISEDDEPPEIPESTPKIMQSSSEGTKISSTQSTKFISMSPFTKTTLTTKSPPPITTPAIRTTQETILKYTNPIALSSSTPCCDRPRTWDTTPSPPILYNYTLPTYPATRSPITNSSTQGINISSIYTSPSTTKIIFTSPSPTRTTYTTTIINTTKLESRTTSIPTQLPTQEVYSYSTLSTPCCDRPRTWETITTTWKVITKYVSTTTSKPTLQSKPTSEPQTTLESQPTFQHKSTSALKDTELPTTAQPKTLYTENVTHTEITTEHVPRQSTKNAMTSFSTTPNKSSKSPTNPFTESTTLPSNPSRPEYDEFQTEITTVSNSERPPRILKNTDFAWWYPTLCESDDCKGQRPITWRTTLRRKKNRSRNHVMRK